MSSIWKRLLSYLLLPLFPSLSSGMDSSPPALEPTVQDPVAELARRITPSVVTISSVDRGGGPWGVGTGFVVDQSGVIATNFHVIGDHREFTVELADGSVCQPVEILAIDRSRDLAVLRIDRSGLPALPLGNSSKVLPGESVISIGNPLGYGLSVSQGVVAAIRELEFGDGRPMVQVAIPIESGSSGSPIINRSGEVLAMLAVKSGGAMGFGIPVNDLAALLDENRSIPIDQWITVGMLDTEEWALPLGGNWRQRAGIIKASGMGEAFGGRMLCLAKGSRLSPPFDLSVEVRLQSETGAAGLVFGSDGGERHYGFYPTNGSLRLTCFDGPAVFDWKIFKTVPSENYQPGQWNHLRVRFEKSGQIYCTVNGQQVIDQVDFTLGEGWVGLCKFREPGAEFRNFRLSARLPTSSIPHATRSLAYEVSESLVLQENLDSADLQSLTEHGKAAHQAMLDRASELETAAERMRVSAERVRVSLIIEELVSSLGSSGQSTEVNLLHSALLVSRLDNPDFNLEHYFQRVDRLAERIAARFPTKSTDRERLDLMIDILFSELGYHGSSLDFHHRSNSYLNEVIDDREGLPITLSVLLMELGKRVNLPISGLATPDHFLTLYRAPQQGIADSVIIDAFGGRVISREQADVLTSSRLSDEDFSPASDGEIISRILRNLLRSAEKDRDMPATLRYLDALIAINPEDRYLRTLRAMNYYGEGRFDESLEDVRRLIGSDREDPANEALLEIERRLIERH